MMRALLERTAERARADLAARGTPPDSITLVAAFFETGVCFKILAYALPCGDRIALPDRACEAIGRWTSFASHVLLCFANPRAARPYGSAALHEDEGYSWLVRIAIGEHVLHYCPPAHEAHVLAGLLHRHGTEARAVLRDNLHWDLREDEDPQPEFLAASSFLLQRPDPLTRVTCLSGHRRALLARAGLADRTRKMEVVRGRLREWLGTCRRPLAPIQINPRTLAEYPMPAAVVERESDELLTFAALEEFARRFRGRLSLRTSSTIALALESVARMAESESLRAPDSELLGRILRDLCDELFRLQIASPALDFHYPDWRRFRGAVRKGRLDDRIDVAANGRILAALDSLAGVA